MVVVVEGALSFGGNDSGGGGGVLAAVGIVSRGGDGSYDGVAVEY